MNKDKRRSIRLDANLFAELVALPSGTSLGRAVVSDVSISGVAVESEADLSRGDQVECLIEVPLVLKAKVMRVDAKGQVKRYGLMFMNQSIFDKFLLKKILKGSRTTRKVSL